MGGRTGCCQTCDVRLMMGGLTKVARPTSTVRTVSERRERIAPRHALHGDGVVRVDRRAVRVAFAFLFLFIACRRGSSPLGSRSGSGSGANPGARARGARSPAIRSGARGSGQCGTRVLRRVKRGRQRRPRSSSGRGWGLHRSGRSWRLAHERVSTHAFSRRRSVPGRR